MDNNSIEFMFKLLINILISIFHNLQQFYNNFIEERIIVWKIKKFFSKLYNVSDLNFRESQNFLFLILK